MNLTPLFKWGTRMISLLEKDKLTEQEREKVNFVLDYKVLIQQMHLLLSVLNKIQKILKNKGFSKETMNNSLMLLNNISDERGLKVKDMISKYFNDNLQKMGDAQTIQCSSDIIESCFSKYKSIVKANKTVGVTDLCLSISCLLGETSLEYTKESMSKIKTTQIKEWKEKNIGQTLYEQRYTLFKKVG